MIRWTCASVKRRLARYHDGELSIDQRRAVDAHLSTCAACAAAVIELDDVGDALRALAHVAPAPERDAFRAEVMARDYAEQANSWAATLDDWRHDVGLRWAGLSAVGATLSCALILFGIAWLVPLDSEGGFTRMPTPTSHDFFLTSYSEPWAPRAGSDAMAAVLSSAQEEDIVLALAAAVAQQDSANRRTDPDDRQTVLRLMNAVRHARFTLARDANGKPVVLWLYAHTTVRARFHRS